MKKNMGTLDRVIRVIVVLGLIGLYYFNIVSGALGITLLVAAGVFTITSALSWCPIYALTGLKTCSVKKQ